MIAPRRKFEIADVLPTQFNGFLAGHLKTINSVYQALQINGIEFIGTPDDAPGVRLRSVSEGNNK